MTVDAEQKTYRGNCHCGSYIFEVTVPELKSVTVCDCSICTKKNYMYLWMNPENDTFKVIKDDGLLTEYSFGGSFGIAHKFCSKCGVSLVGTSKNGMVLNARALQDVNFWDLEIKTCDGAKLDPQYKAPAFTGPEPALPEGTDSSNAKVYHGSCHCGAITAAVKLPAPIEDKDTKERIVECNCSICSRAGFTWVYPARSQVILQERDTQTDPGSESKNLVSYAFNRGVFNKTFCKTCGVYLTNEVTTTTSPEEMAAWPEDTKAFYERVKHVRPLNIRVLNDFDFSTIEFKIERLDGASRPVFYVNP
ncbi:hypothetical protein QBC37DRAFT_427304 [Rhypophila decipiens]|uniref:CENP-V/GFA domain-containing protein n=1 Tax=Rhypophila decipiens TaxID=261697 RepID=A0AAN6Y4L7_9PEZI|nr:hypothetical protein QBC37DRAFT_427304 [Rhypophila decipiens]